MPPRRKLSIRQLEILVEFAESNTQIAFGRFSAGPLSSQATRQAWNAVAIRLNSVAEGAIKTPDQWRRYWIEYKAKTRTKAADNRRNATATGGGPNRLIALTELEKRVLALIGPVAVEGLPGVKIPFIQPVDIPATSHNVSVSQPSTSSAVNIVSDHTEPVLDEEWLDVIEDSENIEEQHIERPQSVNLSEVIGREHTEISQPRPADTRRQRLQRQSFRKERIPRWAYDLESRRLAVEERHASALEALVTTMESGVNIFRDLCNEFKIYLRRNENI